MIKAMIDLFEADDLEKLAEIRGTCISIYIPAHEAGIEVNENMDKISFKNEFQKVQQILEEYGYKNREIENLLSPAKDLLDDLNFWKDQSRGLTAFISKDFFKAYRLPISFMNFSVVSSRFIITPIIPTLQLRNKFFILSLNKYTFKLYQCTMSEISEVEIDEILRQKVEEALAPFGYKNDLYEPVIESRDPLNESRKKQILERAKEKGDVNLPEFFRLVNEIVMMKLKEEDSPLVLAALDEWQGDFRKVNKYRNLWEKGYTRNAEFLTPRQLHEDVLEIMKPYFEGPRDNALSKYQAMAGTGQTSDDIEKIVLDAATGRVESLFVEKDTFLWGRFDPVKNSIEIVGAPDKDNYCLISYACINTLKNKGMVYILDKDIMPAGSSMACVYRY
jgi:hypothetical protein